MHRFFENLKTQSEENPMLALGVAAGLITAISKLVNSRIWAQEVNRRAKKTK